MDKQPRITRDHTGTITNISGFHGEYRWLSNFWYSPINDNGIIYPTVEHAFQANKTMDMNERIRISELSTPQKAKTAGKKVSLRIDWEDVKLDIMLELTMLKYQDPKLRQLLLDTGDAYLEESNWWGDVIWGICKGVGTNWLGITIMMCRTILQY